MKRTILIMMAILTVLLIQSGCSSKKMKETGFLSDYSKLRPVSDSILRYINETEAPKYTAFIVDPIQIRFVPKAKTEKELTDQQIKKLTDYMQMKVVEAIQGAGLKVVNKPGPNVAEIRIALTDIEKTDAINMIPQASLLGAGVGGASMETEVIDSVAGQQIGAMVQSRQGSRIPFSNLGDWTAAKNVMDVWAQHFENTLKTIHAKQ